VAGGTRRARRADQIVARRAVGRRVEAREAGERAERAGGARSRRARAGRRAVGARVAQRRRGRPGRAVVASAARRRQCNAANTMIESVSDERERSVSVNADCMHIIECRLSPQTIHSRGVKRAGKSRHLQSGNVDVTNEIFLSVSNQNIRSTRINRDTCRQFEPII
jgi:hypothetical protein